MGAPDTAIRAAFTARLQCLPSDIDIAWENIPFTPVVGTPYLKPSLLPGEPSQAEQGENGRNRHVGVYQVSVFYPAGTGTAEANALRDEIIDHFKRGMVLTYGELNVSVTKSFTGPMMQETDWIHIPVTIRYRADAPN